MSGENKETEEGRMITPIMTPHTQPRIEPRNRSFSYSEIVTTDSPSVNNSLAVWLKTKFKWSSTSNLDSIDATPVITPSSVNLGYSPTYSSFRSSQPSTSGTSTAYRSTLPSTVQPIPSNLPLDKKIQVKITGKFYDISAKVPTYPTHSKNRGEVLIINNVMFKDKGYRHGAKIDDEKLKNLFEQMGFKVTVTRDLKAAQMSAKVRKFSKKGSLNSVDIAMVIVMSHGTRNVALGGTEMFGVDEEGISVDDIMENFNPIHCKSMANKPKIFIFQCCRGDKQPEEFMDSMNGHRNAIKFTRIPLSTTLTVTDALIAYSTLPGFISHRDPIKGTWYISALCEVFSQHAHEYHVEDLLKMVDVKLGQLFNGRIKQTTHYESRGFRRCYLHPVTDNNNLHPLDVNVDVKFSSHFYDSEEYNKTGFYSTRSKNRGHVLIINNIKFSHQKERRGAAGDERNLRELFEKMGLTVFSYTDLSANDMYFRTREFAKPVPHQAPPDIGIIIVMSHGVVTNEGTMILSSDDTLIPEDDFKKIFNNENCVLFQKKPKIFIYQICRTERTELTDVPEETMTDDFLQQPLRIYSDMLIGHASVKGYPAHRGTIKGAWYIQSLCKVFREHAHDLDVESMFRKLDEELEELSSRPCKMAHGIDYTQQTATSTNIGFKKCYIHPGLYEQGGKVMHFGQTN